MGDNTPDPDEIVGRLNYRGDIRHADWAPVGPTPDGRFLVPAMVEYDEAADRTTAYMRTATTQDFGRG